MTADTELRRALAPLRDADPPAALADRVLAPEAPPRRRGRAPRRRRLALLVPVATALLVAATALLPAREAPAPGAVAVLRAAAATAAEQPPLPPFTGYRYVRMRDRWTTPAIAAPPAECVPEPATKDRAPAPRPECRPPAPTGSVTEETIREQWVDVRWEGRRRVGDGRVVGTSGRVPGGEHPLWRAEDEPFVYGDGAFARIPLAELPTDPAALDALLHAAYRDGRWGPAMPDASADQERYERFRLTLNLLTEAHATPALRAAVYGVLARFDGVRALGPVRDGLGRPGQAIEVTLPPGMPFDVPWMQGHRLRLVYDPDSSEVLEWSETTLGGPYAARQVHLLEETGVVADTTSRP